MRALLTVSVALLCVIRASLPCNAQEITLDAKDTDMTEVAASIAKQGNVAIIIPTHMFGTVKLLRLDKSTIEVALQQLSQATGITVTKLDPTTYILGNRLASASTGAPVKVAAPPAKPYAITIRLGDVLTQQIQIHAHDTFSVSTSIQSTQYLIEGTNDLDASGMTVSLRIARTQNTEQGGMSSKTVGQWLHTNTEGKAITLGDAALPFSVSVRKSAQ